MSVVAVKTLEVSRPLRILVPMIQSELELAKDAGLEHYRKAGEMLIESRSNFTLHELTRGTWSAWVKRTFNLSLNQARDYIRLVQVIEQQPTVTFESLRQANRPNIHSQGPWVQPVRDIASRVNVEALRREQQSKEREAQLLRQLSVQLIDIGYKVLASKLHPDKGGNAESMARLNAVRAKLKGVF